MRMMRITESTRIARRRQLFHIIAAPLVDWLRKQDFPMPQPPIRFYPDGSLWTDDYSVLRWTHESVIGGRKHRELQGVEQLIHHYLPGAYTSVRFRPLGAFGGSQDDDLSHVWVLVRLRRKFTVALAEELAGVVQRWLTEIGSKGVFGESGLKSISPVLRCLDKCGV